ncbi:MAG: hypothetical protein M0C28_05615 [Candidatus Moduliflexus flocculans]|nr:hypothetical protein [Candidatus Moduliflexus flocculans]
MAGKQETHHPRPGQDPGEDEIPDDHPGGRGPGPGDRPHGDLRHRRRRPGHHGRPPRGDRQGQHPGRHRDDVRLRRAVQRRADDDGRVQEPAAREIRLPDPGEAAEDLRPAHPGRPDGRRTSSWPSAAKPCTERDP